MSPADTIQQGKDWLRARLRDGASCPLCGQRAQLYRRKVNSGMAKSLISIYRIGGLGWVHVSAFSARSREEGKLAYWGLLEEQAGTNLAGSRGGYWRVTPRGEAFLRNQVTIPKYALVYDGRVLGFEGDRVTIKDALGTKFDYGELMSGI